MERCDVGRLAQSALINGEKSVATVQVRPAAVENQYTATAGSYEINITPGSGLHPRSIDFLLLSLGTCIVGTVHNYMKRNGLRTDGLAIRLSCDLDEKANCYGDISAALELGEGLTEKQIFILSNVAKTCRIHKTLERKPAVKLEVSLSGGRE